jgi:folate-binding protein YgfZ
MDPLTLREYEHKKGARLDARGPLHYGSPEEEYFALRRSGGWIDLSHWTKIRVGGQDRWEWLQGQISQDVSLLRERGYGQACLLTPTGQIVADLFGVVWGEDVFLIAGETPPARVRERLARMVILEDVTIEDVTPSLSLVALQGPSVREVPRPLEEGLRIWEQDVTGSGGFLVLGAEGRLLPLLEELVPVGLEAWDIARLEWGLPLYGRDFDESTLVMELGDAFVSPRVSWDKGCYTGQEVVARIVSRGHTNRTWVGLRSEGLVEEGASVKEGSGREIGRVTSSALSPLFGPLASAFVRNEYCGQGTEVVVGGIRAWVFPFPLFPQEGS